MPGHSTPGTCQTEAGLPWGRRGREDERASLTTREGCNVPGKAVLSGSATDLVQMTLKGGGIPVSPPLRI